MKQLLLVVIFGIIVHLSQGAQSEDEVFLLEGQNITIPRRCFEKLSELWMTLAGASSIQQSPPASPEVSPLISQKDPPQSSAQVSLQSSLQVSPEDSPQVSPEDSPQVSPEESLQFSPEDSPHVSHEVNDDEKNVKYGEGGEGVVERIIQQKHSKNCNRLPKSNPPAMVCPVIKPAPPSPHHRRPSKHCKPRHPPVRSLPTNSTATQHPPTNSTATQPPVTKSTAPQPLPATELPPTTPLETRPVSSNSSVTHLPLTNPPATQSPPTKAPPTKPPPTKSTPYPPPPPPPPPPRKKPCIKNTMKNTKNHEKHRIPPYFKPPNSTFYAPYPHCPPHYPQSHHRRLPPRRPYRICYYYHPECEEHGHHKQH